MHKALDFKNRTIKYILFTQVTFAMKGFVIKTYLKNFMHTFYWILFQSILLINIAFFSGVHTDVSV